MNSQADFTKELFDNAPDAMFITRFSGPFLAVNQCAADRLGYTIEELKQLSPQDIDLLFSPTELLENIEKIKEEGFVCIEALHIGKQGQRIPTELMCRMIEYQGDAAVFTIARDLRSRNEAQVKLKEKNRMMQATEAIAQVGSWTWDIEGETLHFSEQWKKIHGVNVDSLPKKQVMPIIHPEDQRRLEMAFEPVFQGERCELTHRIIRQNDGSVRYVRVAGQLFTSETGQEQLVGICRDITLEVETNQRLMESEARFRALFNKVTDAILVTDGFNRPFVMVNNTACTMLGYSREELLQLRPMDIHPDDSTKLTEEHFENQRMGAGVVLDHPVKCKDGSIKYVDINTATVEVQGRPHQVGIFHDVTHRRWHENLEKQSQRFDALERLAGGFAHDFNNILQSVVGFAELVRKDIMSGSVTAKTVDFTEELLNSGKRAADLIKQVQLFGKYTDREQIPTSIGMLVNDAVKNLRTSFPPGITVLADIEPELPDVKADALQLHQVFMNLGWNSREAIGDRTGVIRYAVNTIDINETDDVNSSRFIPGKYIRIQVIDNGPGMDRSIQDRVFEPYFTTRKSIGKSGLGMSVVRGIVQGHNGYIDIESDRGEGATVIITLPACERTKEPVSKEIAELSVLEGTEHLLIVDDDNAILSYLRILFQNHGYTVTTQDSSRDALKLFVAQPETFPLVIADLAIPEMSGIQMLQEMYVRYPGVKTILYTGYSKVFDDDNGREKGISTVLYKPVNPERLLQTVRRLLDADRRENG